MQCDAAARLVLYPTEQVGGAVNVVARAQSVELVDSLSRLGRLRGGDSSGRRCPVIVELRSVNGEQYPRLFVNRRPVSGPLTLTPIEAHQLQRRLLFVREAEIQRRGRR